MIEASVWERFNSAQTCSKKSRVVTSLWFPRWSNVDDNWLRYESCLFVKAQFGHVWAKTCKLRCPICFILDGFAVFLLCVDDALRLCSGGSPIFSLPQKRGPLLHALVGQSNRQRSLEAARIVSGKFCWNMLKQISFYLFLPKLLDHTHTWQ